MTNGVQLRLTQTAILICLGIVVIVGVLGAVMAEARTVEILGFCSLVVVSLLGVLQATTARKVEETVNKVEEVAKVADTIHTLVNSQYGVQLRISMVALRRVAEVTKDPKDAEAAEMAESLYHEHQAKEAVAEAGKKIPVT